MRLEPCVFIGALQSNRSFKQVYRNTDLRIDQSKGIGAGK